jgi:hypothetical protein
MDKKERLEYTNEGEMDFQENTGELQRPVMRKDYGKEAGKAPKDLEKNGKSKAKQQTF